MSNEKSSTSNTVSLDDAEQAVSDRAAQDVEKAPHLGTDPKADAIGVLTERRESDPEHGQTQHDRHSITDVQAAFPVEVPRSKRRGLLSRFAIIAEVQDPTLLPRKTKWLLTFVVAFSAVAAPMASSIVLPSLTSIADEFHASHTTVNLTVALYMLSLAIFPLWWSSASETLGRRSIYIVSFALFLLFNILGAISTSMAMFIVMRILEGGAAGSVQAVGAGSISDFWHPVERGNAMYIFYLGPLCGPLIAPIVGGALQLRWGWRSVQWFLAIYSIFALLLIIFVLPETLRAKKSIVVLLDEQSPGAPLTRTSTRRTIQQNSKRIGKALHQAFLEPLSVVLYLRFPLVALIIYYAAITFGCLYMLSISIQAIFEAPPYNFTSIEVGCVYISNSLGYFSASTFAGRWSDKVMIRAAEKANDRDKDGNLIYKPEDRLQANIWIGALMYPAALLIYGWLSRYGIFWFAPIVFNFFFGLGSMIIFGTVTTMLTEFMPKRTSCAVALNNLARNTCACIGTIVTQPLLTAVGNGWMFTGVFVITTVNALAILAIKRNAKRWRAQMDEETLD